MDDNQSFDSGDTINNKEIRQHLVNTAVNFLLNPDVRNKPDSSKTAFLQKKGLSEAEIAAAIEQAKSDPRSISTAYKLDGQQNNVIPYPLPYAERNVSFWSRLNSISTSLAVLAVALYGLQRFYKLYVEPWLFGRRKSPMEELFEQLNSSICELKTAVSNLESTVKSQKEQIDRILLPEDPSVMPLPLAVAELKGEICSVKSLLINRHQFPAAPKVHIPSIPVWQLAASESENAGSESKASGSSEDISEDKSIALKSCPEKPIQLDKPNFMKSPGKTEINGLETTPHKEVVDNNLHLSDKMDPVLQSEVEVPRVLATESLSVNGTHSDDESVGDVNKSKDTIQSSD